MNRLELWERYKKHLCVSDTPPLRLDISRMRFDDSFLEGMREPLSKALSAMEDLEKGAIANVDENRMVGHYWLRTPELASDPEIGEEITETLEQIKQFAADVHAGHVLPEKADGFYVVLVVGIGGSALGPQLIADALSTPDDAMLVLFIDNTDPEGIDRTLAELDDQLAETLTIVISKSGGTKETRNGMLEVEAAYKKAGLNFAKHAVAVTGEGSNLDKLATDNRWLRVFPMWDWVGGRTSVCSAVGMLPAALQGLDIDKILAGARDCDAVTRQADIETNPAAIMAAMWHYAGGGQGDKELVILPYCDRLALLSKYLQQLIMESLGKRLDRDGKEVCQGLTVYGNKGSTDQHAYVQQLRDGLDSFFVTFVEVLRNRNRESIRVEDDFTSADFLHGFLRGTRAALYEQGRESMTLSIDRMNAYTLGSLIGLFERTVGLYAELININAYHQPGVEAGKKAAGDILALHKDAIAHLRKHAGERMTAEAIAKAIGAAEDVEDIHHILQHALANGDHDISCKHAGDICQAEYWWKGK